MYSQPDPCRCSRCKKQKTNTHQKETFNYENPLHCTTFCFFFVTAKTFKWSLHSKSNYINCCQLHTAQLPTCFLSVNAHSIKHRQAVLKTEVACWLCGLNINVFKPLDIKTATVIMLKHCRGRPEREKECTVMIFRENITVITLKSIFKVFETKL